LGNIVLIKDLLDQKRRKEEELARYSSYLASLKTKLDYIRKEIALTEKIISMVKKEEIIEISKE